MNSQLWNPKLRQMKRLPAQGHPRATAETGTEFFNLDHLAHDPMLSWKGCQEDQGRFSNLAIDQNHLRCLIDCRVFGFTPRNSVL